MFGNVKYDEEVVTVDCLTNTYHTIRQHMEKHISKHTNLSSARLI